MNKSNHPYHLVTISPWPLLTSLSLMNFLTGIINWFFDYNINLLILGMMNLLMCMMQWWRDIIRESTFQGCHTQNIIKLIKFSMILFIISELFFFLSFFWAYFHMALSPSIEIGEMWPPKFITPFNPFNIPLLNTITLLSSGISITWSHFKILNNNFYDSLISLWITIYLGIYFTFLQYIEYNEASFTISDSVFGSTFFMITGFHGLHVIIGMLFILITTIRLNNKQFSKLHHLGFEISSWYWHFVDVIWLLVYIFIYWWNY